MGGPRDDPSARSPASPPESATPARPAEVSAARPGTIVQRGRAKAYRPLPAERRREILLECLAAYDRGDYFLAHELLEPAWMGASDSAERDFYQGLIKLAAAFVHDARGNPAGFRKNLAGARTLLADAVGAGRVAQIDVSALLTAIDGQLDRSSRADPIPIFATAKK